MFCVEDSTIIKDIRIYIVICIIYNNVAIEITRLQKNMVALRICGLQAPPAPLWIQPSLIVRLPPQLLKSSTKAIFFSSSGISYLLNFLSYFCFFYYVLPNLSSYNYLNVFLWNEIFLKIFKTSVEDFFMVWSKMRTQDPWFWDARNNDPGS